MVRPDKQRAALQALNAVLVVARSRAYAGESAELAHVLGTAEYLPLLMLDTEDRTATFRDQLVDLSQQHIDFTVALERFDRG